LKGVRSVPRFAANRTKGGRRILELVVASPDSSTWAGSKPQQCAEFTSPTRGPASLDHFILLGEQPMNYLVREMVAFYHEFRPHQAKDNDLLVAAGGGANSRRCLFGLSRDHRRDPFVARGGIDT